MKSKPGQAFGAAQGSLTLVSQWEMSHTRYSKTRAGSQAEDLLYLSWL